MRYERSTLSWWSGCVIGSFGAWVVVRIQDAEWVSPDNFVKWLWAEQARMYRCLVGMHQVANSRARFHYEVFGHRLLSEMSLPELDERPPSEVCEERGQAAIHVHIGNPILINEDVPDSGIFTASEDEVTYVIPSIGRFVVRDGRQIEINPERETTKEAIRLYLLGIGLATVLHQRGLTVLHGSGVVVDRAAVLFIGEKGAGKSTMAAKCQQSGYPLITDDIAVLDMNSSDCTMVLPGFRQLKLWPESMHALGRNPQAAPRIHRDVSKRIDRPDGPMAKQAVPVRSIYVLDEDEELAVDPLQGGKAFEALMRHSFLSRLLHESNQHLIQFRRCTKLLRRGIPVYRLRRPKDFRRLDEVVRVIVRQITDET